MTALPSVRRKTSHQQRVEEFMTRGGHEVPDRPMLPSDDVRWLRAKLLSEELCELVSAMGMDISISIKQQKENDFMAGFCFRPAVSPPDLVKIADGCADLSVVTIGTLSACGIADESVLEEVDRSNLDKVMFGPIHRDSSGKILKPEGWRPPNLDGILAKQGFDAGEVVPAWDDDDSS